MPIFTERDLCKTGVAATQERAALFNLLEKCGGLPTAATMKKSFSEVSTNECCCILNVTLDQERRFWVKRWKQTKALKPSRKQPAVVGSGTAVKSKVAEPLASPYVKVPVKS